jgi:hypothetical protein
MIFLKIRYFKTLFLVYFLLINLAFAQDISFNHVEVSKNEYFQEIPFKFIKNKIYVAVNIDNSEYQFLLDTGSPTMISKDLFNKLNPKIIAYTDITDVNKNKIDSACHFNLSQLKIGETEFRNIRCSYVQNPILDCKGIDGVLGSNLFCNSALQICFSRRMIMITNDSDKFKLKGKDKYYFKTPNNRSTPIISVKLKGIKGKSLFADFVFDTGYPFLISLSDEYSEVFKAKNILMDEMKVKGSSRYGFAGLEEESIQIKWTIPNFRINKLELDNVQVRSGKISIIGCQLIKYGDITIDYKNKNIAILPYNKTTIKQYDNLPVDFVIRDSKLFIGTVWKKDLGVSVGDQVLSINKNLCTNVNYCDLLFNTSIDNEKDIYLELKKVNGEIVTVELEKFNK